MTSRTSRPTMSQSRNRLYCRATMSTLWHTISKAAANRAILARCLWEATVLPVGAERREKGKRKKRFKKRQKKERKKRKNKQRRQ